jgi:caa(3)-type oxidase subunit IV
VIGLNAARRVTLVWVLLLALTIGSVLVGVEQGAWPASTGAVVIIGIALLKVRLIGVHFMDLRVAPRVLRTLFEGYVLAVFVALVAIALVVHP